MYGVISSLTKKIKKVYGSIESTTKEVKKIYGVVGGITKLIYSSEIKVTYPFYLIKNTASSDINSYLLNGTTIAPYESDYPTTACTNIGGHSCRENGSYFMTTNTNRYNSGVWGLYYRCSTHCGGFDRNTFGPSILNSCSTNVDGDIFSGMCAVIYPPKINDSYDYLVGRNINIKIDRGNGEYVFYGIYVNIYGTSTTQISATRGLSYVYKVNNISGDKVAIHLYSGTCSIDVRFNSIYID